MRLIIGLGNPGREYLSTRHNAGYLLVDRLQKTKFPKDVVVKKSNVFMNESGGFIHKLVDHYSLAIDHLYIAHDDLDIPLGSYKIQFGIGPKVHNGVNSVETELGSKDFWRIRIGVDNRAAGSRLEGEEYVLQNFTEGERKTLEAVFERICKEIDHLLH